jgi:hypothetical protein
MDGRQLSPSFGQAHGKRLSIQPGEVILAAELVEQE